VKVSQVVADPPFTQEGRTSLAETRLRRIAGARLVITGKVHAALASRALGTPVVLIDSDEDVESRIGGLRPLFNVVRTRASEGRPKDDFDWRRPPPSPGSDLLGELVERCEQLLAARGLRRTRSVAS
jgi:ADP-heptose:LPS heptosyltransferase